MLPSQSPREFFNIFVIVTLTIFIQDLKKKTLFFYCFSCKDNHESTEINEIAIQIILKRYW